MKAHPEKLTKVIRIPKQVRVGETTYDNVFAIARMCDRDAGYVIRKFLNKLSEHYDQNKDCYREGKEVEIKVKIVLS